jgi:hypothetical protein
MTDFERKFYELQRAIQAYDRALRAYGLLGAAQVESDKLDRLWAAVLRAAELPTD